MEIKKGSKMIWIIQDNLKLQVDDTVLLQKINTYLFSFEDDWVSEWT